MGVNDTGHDVTFFGATSGCKFLWDEDANTLILCAAAITTGASVFCNTITVGVDDTGYDVKLFGASAGAFMLYDESADTLDVRGATAAGPGVLKLTTGELTNVDGCILGRLEFQAPLDSAGTDACLVSASIYAEADATFSASVNTTDLVFATATSATATERMRVYSNNPTVVGIGPQPGNVSCFFCNTVCASGLVIYNENAGSVSTNSYYSAELTLAAKAINTQAIINFLHGHPCGPSDTGSGQILYNLNNCGFSFKTAGNNVRMTIDKTGNVGIGTTAPVVAFEVEGIASNPCSCDGACGVAYFAGEASCSGIALGSFTTTPWNNWIQSQTDSGVHSALILQPRGNHVGIGIAFGDTNINCWWRVPTNAGDASGMVIYNPRTGWSTQSVELTLSAAEPTTQGVINFTKVYPSAYSGQILYNFNDDSMNFRTLCNNIHLMISCHGTVCTRGTDDSVWGLRVEQGHATAPWAQQLYFSGGAPDNSTAYFQVAQDTSAVRAYLYGDGDWANHDGVYGQISDVKLKQDITDMRSYWDDFASLQYRKFRHKTDVEADADAPYRIGLIAQEVETIFPGLVPESPEGPITTITGQDEDGNDMTESTPSGTTHKWVKSSIIEGPIMASVVQELQTRVKSLEACVIILGG